MTGQNHSRYGYQKSIREGKRIARTRQGTQPYLLLHGELLHYTDAIVVVAVVVAVLLLVVVVVEVMILFLASISSLVSGLTMRLHRLSPLPVFLDNHISVVFVSRFSSAQRLLFGFRLFGPGSIFLSAYFVISPCRISSGGCL